MCVKIGGGAVVVVGRELEAMCYVDIDCNPGKRVKIRWNGPGAGGLCLDQEHWRPVRTIRFGQNSSLAAVVEILHDEGCSMAAR